MRFIRHDCEGGEDEEEDDVCLLLRHDMVCICTCAVTLVWNENKRHTRLPHADHERK